jgi:hypothetical protein
MCPVPCLCCILPACGVELVDTEGNYSSCIRADRDPLKIEDYQIKIKAIQTIIQYVGHYAYCGLNLSKSCVVCTFEFLISAHPNPKPTTLGISLGGQPDKTRQLARQVGERIRDPLENSLAFFKFPSPVLPDCTTFVFGSWVCVANRAGGFHRHIVDDTIKLKTLAERLDNFIDNLDELPFFDSARETEAESVTTVPFSALEKDLDSLLQAGGSDATACRGA